ncbi:hypothetical protein ACIGW8_39175 [Streptomyces sioyaensis]|uniref:hypothetical protein n=1 Tax=Streptomyces sioyaensis TaxID=67364 RepID=UPI0037D200EB
MKVAFQRRLVAGAGTVAAVALGGVMLAPVAQAAAPSPSVPATITSGPKGLGARALPTRQSTILHTYKAGEQVKVACQINAQPVHGNQVWYRLANKIKGKDAWLPLGDHNVAVHGKVGNCTMSPKLTSAQLKAAH